MTEPTPDRRKRRQFTVRITEATEADIHEFAEREQRTSSDMARILLAEAIAARRKREGRTR